MRDAILSNVTGLESGLALKCDTAWISTGSTAYKHVSADHRGRGRLEDVIPAQVQQIRLIFIIFCTVKCVPVVALQHQLIGLLTTVHVAVTEKRSDTINRCNKQYLCYGDTCLPFQ